MQLVSLQPSLVLALAILSNGNVEKCVLHLADEADDATVAAAGRALDAQLTDARWSSLPEAAITGNGAADRLAIEARNALAGRGEHESLDPLYVGGASRLAAEREAFPTSDTAARLLELLEHQSELVALVRELLVLGPTVSIGSENPLDDLRDCSIVVAPYRVDGEVAGTVGVLGPTRMDYRQALAAVEAISQQLGHGPLMNDYYEILGISRDRDRRRHQARRSRTRTSAPPRQQPRRSRKPKRGSRK